LARFTLLNDAQRDALLGHIVCVLHELSETPTSQATRPPQPDRRGDRAFRIVVAEHHGRVPDTVLNLLQKE
jgi:hypothetical protein